MSENRWYFVDVRVDLMEILRNQSKTVLLQIKAYIDELLETEV